MCALLVLLMSVHGKLVNELLTHCMLWRLYAAYLCYAVYCYVYLYLIIILVFASWLYLFIITILCYQHCTLFHLFPTCVISVLYYCYYCYSALLHCILLPTYITSISIHDYVVSFMFSFTSSLCAVLLASLVRMVVLLRRAALRTDKPHNTGYTAVLTGIHATAYTALC